MDSSDLKHRQSLTQGEGEHLYIRGGGHIHYSSNNSGILGDGGGRTSNMLYMAQNSFSKTTQISSSIIYNNFFLGSGRRAPCWWWAVGLDSWFFATAAPAKGRPCLYLYLISTAGGRRGPHHQTSPLLGMTLFHSCHVSGGGMTKHALVHA